MNLTPLKYLLFMENVTTVFRNYLSFKKQRTRLVIVLWVVFESFNIPLSAYANFACESEFKIRANRIYFFTSTAFSIYVMIASLYYSKRFHCLLLNFDSFYNIFDDKIFNQTMLKAQKALTSLAFSFCGIKMSTFAYIRLSLSDDVKDSLVTTLSHYSISMSDFRYIFQYFIVFSIVFVISEQLKAITRSIDAELSEIRENRGNVEQANSSSSAVVYQGKILKWVQAYENINDTCNLCNIMFSTQLIIMILIVTVYYIILMYSIAILTVKGVTIVSSLLTHMVSMVVFLMVLFMVSRGGQKVQNNYLELQRKLCKLCVHSLQNEEYYKLVKDLLRCVRTRPVRVHLCGTMDVNMSMLPSVVAFFTSYTVIALQFSNVL